MSRRRRRDRSGSEFLERDVFTPSLTRLARLPQEYPTPAEYRLVEDRRTYHPLEFFRPARVFSGADAPASVPSPTPRNKPRAFLAHGLKFPVPNEVLVCVRRKQRKEVLHAFKKVGRGRGGGRKRRNWWSAISC